MNLNCRSCRTSIPRERRGNHKQTVYSVVIEIGRGVTTKIRYSKKVLKLRDVNFHLIGFASPNAATFGLVAWQRGQLDSRVHFPRRLHNTYHIILHNTFQIKQFTNNSFQVVVEQQYLLPVVTESVVFQEPELPVWSPQLISLFLELKIQ